MQVDNSDKKEKLMGTMTKYRESVPRFPSRKITSRLGGWEGLERREKGRHQSSMGGMVFEPNLAPDQRQGPPRKACVSR